MNRRTRKTLAIVLVMASAILLAGVAKKVMAFVASDGWNINPRVFAYCAGEEPELIAVGQEK